MTLITLLHAIEHRLVGSVERATKPLNKIVAKLDRVRAKANIASEVSHAYADAIRDHAFAMGIKATAAAARAQQIAELLG